MIRSWAVPRCPIVCWPSVISLLTRVEASRSFSTRRVSIIPSFCTIPRRTHPWRGEQGEVDRLGSSIPCFSFDGPGVLICSIDNMPTQLPLEATVYFGSRVLPLIPQLMEVDAKKDFEKQIHVPRVLRDVSLGMKRR